MIIFRVILRVSLRGTAAPQSHIHLSADELPVLRHDDHLPRVDISHSCEADGPKGAVLRGNAPFVLALGAGTLPDHKRPGKKQGGGTEGAMR